VQNENPIALGYPGRLELRFLSGHSQPSLSRTSHLRAQGGADPTKQKEQRIAPLLPGLYPPPGTSPNSYCSAVQPAQAVFEAAAAVPVALKRITPSEFEQKARTPVWPNDAGLLLVV